MESQLKKIMCPVDFSDPSERALEEAVSLAKLNGAVLALITVVQPLPATVGAEGTIIAEMRTTVPGMMTDMAEDYLNRMRDKQCAEIRDQTSTQVAVGVPFVEIVRAAREFEADLIVMGSHGRTGLEHLLIGSVAERVVRKAPCSVLVVRDKARQFVMP
mgnify:CR=1 FL=1